MADTDASLTPEQQAAQRLLMRLRIVWFMMLQALLLYAVLPFVLQLDGVELEDTLQWALAGLGVVTTVAAPVVSGMLKANGADLQTYTVVRFAMAEAAGVLGLVILLLGGSQPVGYACLVMATCGMLVSFPRDPDA